MSPEASPTRVRLPRTDLLIALLGLSALAVYLLRGRLGGGTALAVVLGLDLCWLLAGAWLRRSR